MKISDVLYNIRKTRELKNYTQEYLAHKLDLDIRSYSNIENGISKLSVARLLHISEIMETPVEQFFNPTQNFMFSNSTQSGYSLNHPSQNWEGFQEAKAAYLNLIEELKAEILFLKNLIDKENN